jgi:hypothetical protein
MNKQASRKHFRILLPFLIIVAYLMSVAPISQPQANSFCPLAQGCIEFTVYNPQTGRCECPNQECCDFYVSGGFVPYGCEGNPSSQAKAMRLTAK